MNRFAEAPTPQDGFMPTATPMDKLHADFLRHFDGLSARTVFIPWLDQESMSTSELQGLWATLNLSACPVVVVNAHTLGQWIHPEHPLPGGFGQLNDRQRSDYLTCYLMHLYGGGIASLAAPRGQWRRAFDRLEHGVSLALHTSASDGGRGLLAMRRNTLLTRQWFDSAKALSGSWAPGSSAAETPCTVALDRLLQEFRSDVVSDFEES